MSESRTGGRSKKAPASATPKQTKAKLSAIANAAPAKPAATKMKAKPAATKGKAKPAARLPAPKPDDATFKKVCGLVLALPDTKLTMTWGSPHFRVGEKIFCGFGEHDGQKVLSVKLEQAHARSVVEEGRFRPAPYVGKHGWVTLEISQRKSWDEVASLLRESYRLIAPKASLAKLR